MPSVKKKICLLGSFAVGKTSLVERFVYNRFDEKYLTTIGVKISQKALPPINSPGSGPTVQHTFLIWDIAGLEKFDRIVQNYFRGAAGALIVSDLTRPETIGDMKSLGDHFKSINPDAVVLILGNKLDLFQENKKAIADLKAVAVDYETDLILTSAKTGEQVEKAFMELSQKIGALHE
jgi:small GTP-binding protein